MTLFLTKIHAIHFTQQVYIGSSYCLPAVLYKYEIAKDSILTTFLDNKGYSETTLNQNFSLISFFYLMTYQLSWVI